MGTFESCQWPDSQPPSDSERPFASAYNLQTTLCLRLQLSSDHLIPPTNGPHPQRSRGKAGCMPLIWASEAFTRDACIPALSQLT